MVPGEVSGLKNGKPVMAGEDYKDVVLLYFNRTFGDSSMKK